MIQNNFISPHQNDPSSGSTRVSLTPSNVSPLFLLLGYKESKEDFKEVVPYLVDGGFDGPFKEVNDNFLISSGWTYFGQLLTHDLTMRRELDNSVPRLNLDCIYGLGLRSSAHLYETYDCCDNPLEGYFALDRYPYIDPDGVAHQVYDVFRTGRNQNMPVMADTRNDDNFLVSQLHCAFLKFHNHIMESYCRIDKQQQSAPTSTFSRVRRFVTWTYQWLIVNEYLKLLTGNVVTDLIEHKEFKILRNYYLEHEPFLMPECVFATLRIGHSQVRTGYRINQYNNELLLFDNPNNVDLGGFKRNKGRGPIDWSFFFPFEKKEDHLQYSRTIDLLLAGPMSEIPGPFGSVINIAEIDIQRSVENGLLIQKRDLCFLRKGLGIRTLKNFKKSLQSLYKNIDPTNTELLAWKLYVEKLLKLKSWPLWLFLLLEARVKGANKRELEKPIYQQLGPLGAQILAEQIVWVLLKDKNSYLACDPSWHPLVELKELSSNYAPVGPNTFSIADILQIAENESLL